MKLNLRSCREKTVIIRVPFILMCMILCGVVLQYKMKMSSNIEPIYKGQSVYSTHNSQNKTVIVLPTLVMACEPKFLDRTMDSLSNFRPDSVTFPIIVALYCNHKANYDVLKSFEWDPSVIIFEIQTLDNGGSPSKGQYYKYALDYVLQILDYKAVIVLEDNLDISPDFFEYFLATYPLLKKDPTIWCVSAWNENCIRGLVELSQYDLLHRTNFFPAKGWMLLYETWREIEPHLSNGLFEETLRNPAVTGGRVCIRPEISRTYKFGAYSSKNLAIFTQRNPHQDTRILNTAFVPFTQRNLSYLLQKNEHQFVSFVYSCPETTAKDLKMGSINTTSKYVRISYANGTMFKGIAKMFGFADYYRHGVPSMGLNGIVQCYINNRRVYFTLV